MASDIKTAVIRVGLGGATGIRPLTGSFSWTPKAAFVFASRGVSDGSSNAHAQLAVGATDGTRQWTITQRSRDNRPSTSEVTRASNLRLLHLVNPDNTPLDGYITFDSFIAGGMLVNVQDAFSADFQMVCVFFGGVDLQAYCDSPQVNGTLDVTAPNFQPDLVLTACSTFTDIPFNDVTWQGYDCSIGFCRRAAANPHPQLSFSVHERHNYTDGNPAVRLDTDEIAKRLIDDADAVGGIVIQDFDAQGFTFVETLVAQNPYVGYLALKLGDRAAWVGNFQTPTATGVFDHTNPGFQPQLVLNIGSLLQTVDTHVGTLAGNEGPDCEACGLVALGSNGAALVDHTVEVRMDDRAPQTVTRSLVDSRIVLHSGTVERIAGDLQQMIATGWRVNYSTVQPAARQWIGLAIEDVPAGAIEAAGLALGAGRAFPAGERIIPTTAFALGAGRSVGGGERVIPSAALAFGAGPAGASAARVLDPAGSALGTGRAEVGAERIAQAQASALGLGLALPGAIAVEDALGNAAGAGQGAASATPVLEVAAGALGLGAALAPAVRVVDEVAAGLGLGQGAVMGVPVLELSGAGLGAGQATVPVVVVREGASLGSGLGQGQDAGTVIRAAVAAALGLGAGRAASFIQIEGIAFALGLGTGAAVSGEVVALIASGLGLAVGQGAATGTVVWEGGALALGAGSALPQGVPIRAGVALGAGVGVGEALATALVLSAAVSRALGLARGTGTLLILGSGAAFALGSGRTSEEEIGVPGTITLAVVSAGLKIGEGP